MSAKPCASMGRQVTRFVVYLRVSTLRQGASGLGSEAQREAVAPHVASTDGRILAEVVETESGKQSTRPQLVPVWPGQFGALTPPSRGAKRPSVPCCAVAAGRARHPRPVCLRIQMPRSTAGR